MSDRNSSKFDLDRLQACVGHPELTGRSDFRVKHVRIRGCTHATVQVFGCEQNERVRDSKKQHENAGGANEMKSRRGKFHRDAHRLRFAFHNHERKTYRSARAGCWRSQRNTHNHNRNNNSNNNSKQEREKGTISRPNHTKKATIANWFFFSKATHPIEHHE